MKKTKSLERKIEILSKTLASFEKKLEKTNSKIEYLTGVIVSEALSYKNGKNLSPAEQLTTFRAKTEQFGERTEHFERPLKPANLSSIRGRHREIIAMLINNGFHTYKQIAKNLNISQSRARAYIAELRNEYHVPLKQIRDPEGYKVGIDVRFVEQLLASR